MTDKEYFNAIQHIGDPTSYKDTQVNYAKFNLQNRLSKGMTLQQNVYIQGVKQPSIIYKKDNLGTSYTIIESLPYDTFDIGNYVVWNDEYWLVDFISGDKDIQTKGHITKCSNYLRYLDYKDEIHEYWGIISDMQDSSNITSSGKVDNPEGGLQMLVPYNEDTKKIPIGKRFILWTEYDKDGKEYPSVFRVMNITHISKTYGVNKIVILTMERDTYNDNDSLEHMIADYNINEDKPSSSNKRCEIIGNSIIKSGGVVRTLEAKFYENDNEVLNEPKWEVFPTLSELHIEYQGNKILLVLDDNDDLIGTDIIVTLSCDDSEYGSCTKHIEVR
jgi:hypothetical protein